MSGVFQFCVSLDQYNTVINGSRTRSDSVASDHSDVSQSALDNPLIQSINRSFFKQGEINDDNLAELVDRLYIAFEQGTVSDDDLMYALRYERSALTKFLLTLSLSTRPESESAIRCLAFASNIDPSFWSEFVDDDYTQHFKYLLNAFRAVPKKVSELLDKMKQLASSAMEGRYIGFDKRDVADYNMQGYEDIDAAEQQLKEQRAEQEELIMVYLLVLTQFVKVPIEMIEVSVENDRDRFRNSTGGYAFSMVTEHINGSNSTMTATITTDESSTSSEIDSFPSSSLSNPWSESIIKYDSDYVEYKFVLQHLVSVTQDILDLTNNIFEDGYQQCLKALIALNAQVPLLDHRSTEIVDMFIKEEIKRSDGGVLTQGVMYLLNENGFPNMSTSEAMAALKFCCSLMAHSTNPNDESESEEDSMKGHFYSNDVKVLVDIAVRELVNIPADMENERLRICYINLLGGIIAKTSWSISTDYYKKDVIMSVLQGILYHDTESCHSLVEELLYNFPYLNE